MNSLSPFLSIDHPCDETLKWLDEVLTHAGMSILRTFDLQDARYQLAGCPCPHHGTQNCDCQMVVLLVYGKAIEPATLVLHGNDGHTWLSLVNSPFQRLDPATRTTLEGLLSRSTPE